jgi:hypothetical protein
MTMDFVAAGDHAAKISVKEQDIKGIIYFDNTAGHISLGKTTMKMKMVINVPGQTIDGDIAATMRFELVPPTTAGATPAK